MKYGEDAKADVLAWLVNSSIEETKRHVSQASVKTLQTALLEVKGKNKGKTEAIRRELFKRLEVGDDVIVAFGKRQCTITKISNNGQYVKLDNCPGVYTWKDIEEYGCPF
jgi:16S rRNA G1207 methylase RsmC